MKHIPILFSTPMVQAILDGRKTQTRRTLKMPPKNITITENGFEGESGRIYKCPYGQVGDILWVRETHYAFGEWKKNGTTKTGKQKWKFVRQNDIAVRFFDNKPKSIESPKFRGLGWYNRSSLFLEKHHCRTFLKVKSIRVERLKDISEKDAESEGINIVDFNCYENYLVDKNWQHNGMNQKGFHMIQDPIGSFASLWAKINGEQSWNDNPWVWVIDFDRIEKPENFI